nr:MAG TPA: hypothetical protein [Caudoviricetes sp.]DAJ55845.1 MAG TPA: hypothetical protein [Caudoviricetes sp.]
MDIYPSGLFYTVIVVRRIRYLSRNADLSMMYGSIMITANTVMFYAPVLM